jgi:hypothetical protein
MRAARQAASEWGELFKGLRATKKSSKSGLGLLKSSRSSHARLILECFDRFEAAHRLTFASSALLDQVRVANACG